MDPNLLQQLGGGGGIPGMGGADLPMTDTAETVYISSLSLLKMLKHGMCGFLECFLQPASPIPFVVLFKGMARGAQGPHAFCGVSRGYVLLIYVYVVYRSCWCSFRGYGFNVG
eukprot:gb/GECG01009899.1/.p1 GENE.gb/GECG01009899.1/~~gb/GECG01009899.1/.p1  ORF type:complete len:113 (+),score=5.29 gb/GECG01009899.1/:1-339(+)